MLWSSSYACMHIYLLLKLCLQRDWIRILLIRNNLLAIHCAVFLVHFTFIISGPFEFFGLLSKSDLFDLEVITLYVVWLNCHIHLIILSIRGGNSDKDLKMYCSFFDCITSIGSRIADQNQRPVSF